MDQIYNEWAMEMKHSLIESNTISTDRLYFHLNSLEQEFNRIYSKINSDTSIDHGKYLISMCNIQDAIQSIYKSVDDIDNNRVVLIQGL